MPHYILRRILKTLVYLLAFIGCILIISELGGGFSIHEDDKSTSVHNLVVKEVASLGKLELVRYNIKDVIEETLDRAWYKGGDTKALVIIAGEAVACVDLTKLTGKDIMENDSQVTVTLPDAEICYVKVDHQRSKIYHVETPVIYDASPVIESAYRHAEDQIREAAIREGILYKAEENAKLLLTPLLSKIAGKDVKIIFSASLGNTSR